MMRALLLLASLGCFGVAVFTYSVAQSDLQLSMAFTGVVGGFALAGLAALLGRLADLQRVPPSKPEELSVPWSERREPPLFPQRRRPDFDRAGMRPTAFHG